MPEKTRVLPMPGMTRAEMMVEWRNSLNHRFPSSSRLSAETAEDWVIARNERTHKFTLSLPEGERVLTLNQLLYNW